MLVLIRGLPGSGKSTMAKDVVFKDFEHYEADQFFIDTNGIYNYDYKKINNAHEWCQQKTLMALTKGKSVVVSNTFTQLSEMEPYIEMANTFGIQPCIIKATGNYSNEHGVSASTIERMRQRWEE